MFRELFRKHATELPRGSELVIVLRSNFIRHSFEDLGARLLRACHTIQKKQVADIATVS
jgi:ribonuclease P protein component